MKVRVNNYRNSMQNGRSFTARVNPKIIELTKEANSLKFKDSRKALESILEAEKIDDKDAVVQGTKAQILLRLNQTAKAAQAAQKAVDLQPSAQGYGILAKCLMSDGQTAKAAQAAQKAVDLQPNAQGYGILAKCLMSDGQTAEAAQAAQKAVDLQPSAQQYGILAEMFRKSKNYVKAMEVIEQAGIKFGSDANFELTRAYCLMNLGETEKSLRSLKKAESYFTSGQFGKGISDSRVKLCCGFIFLLDYFGNGNVRSEEIIEEAKKSAELLSLMDREKLGIYQRPDFENAMDIAKKFSLF